MLKARFQSCRLVSARAFQQVIKFKRTKQLVNRNQSMCHLIGMHRDMNSGWQVLIG